MMVFDTVHSSSVGRIHAGQSRRMKIVLPLHSLQGSSEAKRQSTLSSASTVEKKDRAANSESRPSLVIRRRIMVPQLEEADDARHFHIQLTPALSNQPWKSSTTPTSVQNHCQEINLVDYSTALRSHVTFARSTQDQVCKSSAAPMTIQAPKTLHLFDLNELPTLPSEFSSAMSPMESPTSTIASADSTTHTVTAADAAASPATDTVTFFSNSSPSSDVTTLTDHVEAGGGDPRGDARILAVDLGLLPAATQTTTRQHNAEESSSMLPQCTEIPTPARKRLRKLSEYADRVHSRTVTHDTVMAKPWTTDGGDVCNHRGNVTKTLAIPEPETKVRGKDVVRVTDDEVLVAASTLLMLRLSSSSLSSKKRRREFSSSFSSIAERTDDDLGGRDSDLAASDPSSPRSLGSGGSVLLRPSNKQRYRSMTELMAQTPILRRVT